MTLTKHIKTNYPKAISNPLKGYRGKVIDIEISSKNKYVESRLRSIRLSTVKERSEQSDTPPAMECRGIN